MNIYEELGIRPFLNAYRPLTRLGGATLPAAVVDAMGQASRENVDLRTLQFKVGAAIAAMTGNEAAYVSCGAASGITLAVATCMAGTNAELADRLPDATGLRRSVVMHKCERGYKSDVAIRCAGATIIDIGTQDGSTEHDLRQAVDAHTAAIFVHDAPARGQLSLERVVAVGRELRIPVLVDAAFSVPPKDAVWKFTRDLGADAVFISGGKGLRGPQSTGLVLGRSWIVQGCTFHGAPNDRIGRGMKVGKEELAGIYAAVKILMASDDRSAHAARLRQIDHVLACVRDLPQLTARSIGGVRAHIAFGAAAYSLTPQSASRWLLEGTPSIYVEPVAEGLIVSAECLEPGDEEIVGRRLRELFEKNQRAAT
jgi:uncharacterized pyridoxal phosphate-dependent enzyme